MITKTRVNRVLSLLLAVVMTLGMFAVTPVTVRADATDATLGTLSVLEGTLSPAFSANTTSYTVSVRYSVTSITVTAEANDKANGAAVTAGYGPNSLFTGSNTIIVTVTAGDGSTKWDYTIIVTRAAAPSSDATLSSLNVNPGTLSPAFNANTTNYTVSVGNSATGITVTAIPTDGGASVTAGANWNALNPGANTITVTVMAEDGTTKDYTINVTRAPASAGDATLSSLLVSPGTLSPAFGANTTSYTVSVGDSVTLITVTAMANASANGAAVTAGSGSHNLSVGANTITVTVTAADGTTKNYTITVTRASGGGGGGGSSSGGGSGANNATVVSNAEVKTAPTDGNVKIDGPAPGISVTSGEKSFGIEIDSAAAERIMQAARERGFSEAYAETYTKAMAERRSKDFATAAGYAEASGRDAEDIEAIGEFYDNTITYINTYTEYIAEGGSEGGASVCANLVSVGIGKRNAARFTKALEELAFGFTEKRAGDNATGLNISEDMKTKILVLSSAASDSGGGQSEQGETGETGGSSAGLTALSPDGKSDPKLVEAWLDAYDTYNARRAALGGDQSGKINFTPDIGYTSDAIKYDYDSSNFSERKRAGPISSGSSNYYVDSEDTNAGGRDTAAGGVPGLPPGGVATTGEGAPGDVYDILARMGKLAADASNETYTESDREAIVSEIMALKKEIDRIAEETEFNTMNLLDGKFNGSGIPVGANPSEPRPGEIPVLPDGRPNSLPQDGGKPENPSGAIPGLPNGNPASLQQDVNNIYAGNSSALDDAIADALKEFAKTLDEIAPTVQKVEQGTRGGSISATFSAPPLSAAERADIQSALVGGSLIVMPDGARIHGDFIIKPKVSVVDGDLILMPDGSSIFKGVTLTPNAMNPDGLSAPLLVGGRLFLPFRKLEDTDISGSAITWDSDTNTVTNKTDSGAGQSGQGAQPENMNASKLEQEEGGGKSMMTIVGESPETGMALASSFGGVFIGPAAAINVSSIDIAEGSLILSLEKNGGKAAYGGPSAPVIIFMPYELRGENPDSIVMYEKNTGKTVAHSFYENGYVVAAVAGPGHYDAKTELVDLSGETAKWAESGIAFAVSHGLMGACGEAFSPNDAVTRAEFITALGILSGADVSGYKWSSFKDVQSDDPAMPYIEWAVSNGIVKGVGDNCFAPDGLITREQIAVMTANYAKATNQALPVLREDNIFADDTAISGWAAYSVMRAQWAGVLAGKPNNLFDPKGNATRAEAGAILSRLVRSVVNG